MSILKVEEVTPKNIRAVIPPKYKGLGYKKLKAGDVVTLTSVVFSVYNAKKNGEPIVTRDGENITNVTVYLGLDDGHYTSLKNDIVYAQMSALVGFVEDSIGYYDYDFDPEKVKVVSVKTKMGQKEIDVLAFESIL